MRVTPPPSKAAMAACWGGAGRERRRDKNGEEEGRVSGACGNERCEPRQEAESRTGVLIGALSIKLIFIILHFKIIDIVTIHVLVQNNLLETTPFIYIESI
jgi:hypothetical protein